MSMKVGQRVGRLTVLGRGEARLMWLCRCDCGREHPVRSDHLRTGATQSCGCLRLETMRRRWDAMTRHGDCRRTTQKTKEWLAWYGMIVRCRDKRSSIYFRYGGRGIVVCQRWNSYENFLADMGRMPAPGYTIERNNNDAGYSPENCRWATRTEQANNRRTSRFLTLGGISRTAAQWSRVLGLAQSNIIARKGRGWSDEATLTVPVKHMRGAA